MKKIIFLSTLLMSGCSYVTYVPVEVKMEHGTPTYVEIPEKMSPEHLSAFQEILDQYGEKYEVKGGKVYVQRSLSEKLDLLANYTEKAEILRAARLEGRPNPFSPPAP